MRRLVRSKTKMLRSQSYHVQTACGRQTQHGHVSRYDCLDFLSWLGCFAVKLRQYKKRSFDMQHYRFIHIYDGVVVHFY